MTDFCIASPHKNELWYDYRLFVNLKRALLALGFTSKAAAHNRIYFLGAPQLQFYPEVGKFDTQANNIALIYSHAEKLQSLDAFSKIFVCSEPVKRYLQNKFKGSISDDNLEKIEVLAPFSSLSPSAKTKPRYACDISFIGTPRVRPIVEAIVPIVEKHQLKFHLFGPNWDSYPGDPRANNYFVARSLPYEEIPMLARGSKICLIDHHQTMSEMGAVSHKYVDFVRAGAFVISDNNKDAREAYAGVCFETPESLEKLILQYLQAPQLRRAQVLHQLSLTSTHTTEYAAVRLAQHFV
ncbi:hypothetical protein ACFO4O_16515 [Glaciecola siphonariae]|uniref:Spore protein YkvP/CgeB glycosyl transferase-like domain-containing protein n=1 Tax=Glaciecola siphonariae TaxID=521012 RepID=A0ABV9LYU0_9ALTE